MNTGVDMTAFRKRMYNQSKRMRELTSCFSAQPLHPFSYYGKEKFADAWGSFVRDNVEVSVKCDLTFRKCIESTSAPIFGTTPFAYKTYITEALAIDNIGSFLTRLNYSCYKHAYKRYGKRINSIVAIEGGDASLREYTSIKDIGKRLHTHMLLQRPSHIDYDKFRLLIIRHWTDTTWGYNQHAIDEIKTIKGSAKYAVKSGMDNLDLTNTYYNDSVLCN